MTRAVVLAAGDGGRLAEQTAEIPKPLVQLDGRALIDFTIEALVSAGVDDVVVVVGYRAGQLRSALTERAHPGVRLRFVTNPRYHAGASLSLRAARPLTTNEPFLLLMADHLLSAPILRRLAVTPREPGVSLIATDASAWPEAYNDEATRVVIDPGSRRVTAIGKGLHPWDALDTGAFLLAPSAWEAVDAAPEDCELSVIFSELARRGQLQSVDVSGATWYDIDTPEDLAAAHRVFAGGAR